MLWSATERIVVHYDDRTERYGALAFEAIDFERRTSPFSLCRLCTVHIVAVAFSIRHSGVRCVLACRSYSMIKMKDFNYFSDNGNGAATTGTSL